jgi:hypothetical protein
MDNLEELKDKNYNAIASLVSLTMDNNAMLRTILDVLVDKHMDGKTDEQKKEIEVYVNECLKNNRNDSAGLMIIAEEPEE